jgi:Flp pilus assembly protein TadD
MNQTTKRTKKTRRNPSPPVAEMVQEAAVELVPYDDTLLECARTQWQFGDWESLASITQETLQHHPQRAKLALLAATGHFQLGNPQEANQFIRLAEDWGCSRKLIVQMLVSGTHNALGYATAILDRPARAKAHFHHAVTFGGIAGDPKLLAEARFSRLVGKIKTNGL